jgi:hypothetical protein
MQQMADKRVVYPIYMLDSPVFGKKFWSLMDQLITSMTSYFEAGNTVPVIVGTDSFEVKRIVSMVGNAFGYPIDVVLAKYSDIHDVSGRFAESICRNRLDECRLDVVTSKIYAMLRLGAEYDRLVVDVDTLWFKKIPWERIEHNGFMMFMPPQWKHMLSITVGQILYYRSRFMAKKPLGDYIAELSTIDSVWKQLPAYANVPWPNSGIIYMTSEFTQDHYVNELDNPSMQLLSVEDETPLVSLLLKFGIRETGIQMNVPVAFTDISMESDLLHPSDIICAHYHRAPKPDAFDITYSGVMRHPMLHGPYSLDFLHDSIASGQYGTMSGILWCYVWRYYYSIACKLYRDGNDTPVYDRGFWKDIIEHFYESRGMWLDSVQAQRELGGLNCE